MRENQNQRQHSGATARLRSVKQVATAATVAVAIFSMASCGGSKGVPAQTIEQAPPPAAPPQTQSQASQSDSGAMALAGALATVRAQGFVSTGATYHPDHQLRVITALRDGSASGSAQEAFFFVGDRYIGTDTQDTSAGITVLSQDDTTVTLNYQRYAPPDPMCCASENFATVRYHWDGQSLQPLDPIPPSDPGVEGSRR